MSHLFSEKRSENSWDAGATLKWEVFLKTKLNPWKIKNTIVGLNLVRRNESFLVLEGHFDIMSYLFFISS